MKNIAIIFVRVLSIYYLVEFIADSIPQIIGIINSGRPMRIAIVGIIISLFVKFLIAIFLWLFADKISSLIISDKQK